MSNMLDQAIVDAQSLREAAIKSAEKAVVEKYAPEVKQAVQKLLEQEPGEEEMDLGLDMGAEDADEESSVMGDIPMAHDPQSTEEEIVVVDLDQIIAAAEEDADAGEESFELGRDEIADEVGIDLEEPIAAANRNDEIEINEDELMDMFKEMLVVDVDEQDLKVAEAAVEAVEEEEAEEEVFVASVADDGMDKKDIEDAGRETGRLEMKNEQLTKQNKDLKDLIIKVKDRLEEVNLSNARLLYANRVLQDTSLNEQQKSRIAELVSGTRSVEEAKMVFETLQKTMAGNSGKKTPQSLSEAVSRRSSVILSGNRTEENTDGNPVKNRWATLAGINNKK
jgi:hypothetical protein